MVKGEGKKVRNDVSVRASEQLPRLLIKSADGRGGEVIVELEIRPGDRGKINRARWIPGLGDRTGVGTWIPLG